MELHKVAKNKQDLENRLINFYGIGAITVNIFLRELRPFWRKANPEPLTIVRKAAEKYKIDLDKYSKKSMVFVRIEAGLIRLRKAIH